MNRVTRDRLSIHTAILIHEDSWERTDNSRVCLDESEVQGDEFR